MYLTKSITYLTKVKKYYIFINEHHNYDREYIIYMIFIHIF
jgi:hypothetical protein